jgi:hypothetical protein
MAIGRNKDTDRIRSCEYISLSLEFKVSSKGTRKGRHLDICEP